MDEDFDACLVLIVTTAKAVINPQDRLKIRKQIVLADKVTHGFTNEWRATKTTAHDDLEPDLARIILMHAKSDIMDLYCGTVIWRPGHRDFEFARQIGEFRMER